MPDFNYPPEFDSPIEDQIFQITNEKSSFEYVFPTFIDPLGDSVTLSLNRQNLGEYQFMHFATSSNTLSLTNPPVGRFTVGVILTDQYDLSVITALNMEVLALVVDPASAKLAE